MPPCSDSAHPPGRRTVSVALNTVSIRSALVRRRHQPFALMLNSSACQPSVRAFSILRQLARSA
jgi:hypothetical protein